MAGGGIREPVRLVARILQPKVVVRMCEQSPVGPHHPTDEILADSFEYSVRRRTVRVRAFFLEYV